MNMRIAIISVLWWGLERLNSSFEKLTRPKDIFELETSWPPLLTAGFCLHIVVISVHQLIVLSFTCFSLCCHYVQSTLFTLVVSLLVNVKAKTFVLSDPAGSHKQERDEARTSPEWERELISEMR